ncbi:hypothetical protein H312_00744 [Anncaliia algerae PRA339]|uniref:Cullin family profile domain-containing protein n=1 Tax=Anncaliia algerae PRA339 TaxID=1288291 RepID=A0A059F3Q7_9MICR|nr:hypothetical protein H312_00744 [Anncaliia algerae PRA339]
MIFFMSYFMKILVVYLLLIDSSLCTILSTSDSNNGILEMSISEKTACLREMKKNIKRVYFDLKELLESGSRFALDEESNKDIRKFFCKLQSDYYFNSFNISRKYDCELEKLAKYFKTPAISSDVVDKAFRVFNNIKFCKAGSILQLCFKSLLIEHNKLHEEKLPNLSRDILALHDKLFFYREKTFIKMDFSSLFDMISNLRVSYYIYKKGIKDFYQLCMSFTVKFESFYKLWSKLDNDQKFEFIKDPKNQEPGESDVLYILELAEDQKNNLQLLYGKMNSFLKEKKYKGAEEDPKKFLKDLINFAYDYEIFRVKVNGLYQYMLNHEDGFKQPQFSMPNSYINSSLESVRDIILDLKSKFLNNETLIVIYKRICRKILLLTHDRPKILEDFLKRKYADTAKIGEINNHKLANLIVSKFSLTQDGIKLLLDRSSDHTKLFKGISNEKAGLFIILRYFLTFDVYAQFLAMKSLKFRLKEDFQRLKEELGDEEVDNKYHSLNDLFERLEIILYADRLSIFVPVPYCECCMKHPEDYVLC